MCRCSVLMFMLWAYATGMSATGFTLRLAASPFSLSLTPSRHSRYELMFISNIMHIIL